MQENLDEFKFWPPPITELSVRNHMKKLFIMVFIFADTNVNHKVSDETLSAIYTRFLMLFCSARSLACSCACSGLSHQY